MRLGHIKREKATEYIGHGALTGGLQAHSIGDRYPLIVIAVGEDFKYAVLNTKTGEIGNRYLTYTEAYDA